MEVPPDRLGGFAWHHGRQRLGGGLLDVAEAAEMREQALAGLRAYTWDVE